MKKNVLLFIFLALFTLLASCGLKKPLELPNKVAVKEVY
ncbi:LPS translocon maturation chaperone LptM [Candidatus Tisiphia endosymbiont of Nemotelus uliginosus]